MHAVTPVQQKQAIKKISKENNDLNG